MVKKLLISLLLCSSAVVVPAKAGFGEGFLFGGFAGLTTGLIASAIAGSNCGPDVVVVEERPVVVYEEPVVVYEPRVVYEQQRVVRQRPCRTQCAQRRCAQPMPAPANKEIVKKTVVETQTVNDRADMRARELALKEQQTELALIEAKRALLNEENRKRELDLKERELHLKRSKPAKDLEKRTVTKTVTTEVA